MIRVLGITANLFATAACTEAPPGTEGGTIPEPPSDPVGPSVWAEVAGTWRVRVETGEEFSLNIDHTADPVAKLVRSSASGAIDSLEISQNPVWLQFRISSEGIHRWFRVRVTDGVFAGRFSTQPSPGKPSQNAYTGHASVYREESFAALHPQVWELTLSHEVTTESGQNMARNELARLRLGSNGSGGTVGRLKVYASRERGSEGEQLEQEVRVQHWDGRSLRFSRHLADGSEVSYAGVVRGSGLWGTWTEHGKLGQPWQGKRAEVFNYGIASGRSATDAALHARIFWA